MFIPDSSLSSASCPACSAILRLMWAAMSAGLHSPSFFQCPRTPQAWQGYWILAKAILAA